MRVRVIAGQFGGRVLDSPSNSRTHPMSERIRNALFNSLGNISDLVVLDAFAGTGALGIEALSRGVKRATFVEKDRIAQKILAKNIAMLGIDKRATVVRANAASWLNTTEEFEYDIIFADPPYHDIQFSTVKELMALLKPGGLMVLSHPGRGELPTRPGVVVVDNRSYGNAALTFYRREDA